MYASKVFESQGLIQRSRTEIGTYKCQFCQKKEYKYHQGLNRHKKDCDMNPDKKRKSTESDEEADMQQKLHQSSANANYKNIMATDCNDKKKMIISTNNNPNAAKKFAQRGLCVMNLNTARF
jgi:hypothetical protein